jgi:hypothetical protein
LARSRHDAAFGGTAPVIPKKSAAPLVIGLAGAAVLLTILAALAFGGGGPSVCACVPRDFFDLNEPVWTLESRAS